MWLSLTRLWPPQSQLEVAPITGIFDGECPRCSEYISPPQSVAAALVRIGTLTLMPAFRSVQAVNMRPRISGGVGVGSLPDKLSHNRDLGARPVNGKPSLR